MATNGVIPHNSPSCSSNQDNKDTLYDELWQACAGPLVSIPRVGDKVYYFPQGHLEQVEAFDRFGTISELPYYNLPFKILCSVVHVKLMADLDTDQVFANVTLLPEKEQEKPMIENECFQTHPKKGRTYTFCKTLTSSDTSTHGGFSVLKRHADETLPPLDMTELTPSQELVTKDLHGFEWRFRHIYRGHPKRHLLTTGWSTFVSSKKLVAGDAFIFLRGENGELRVGVRRAMKPHNNAAPAVLSTQSMQLGVLALASHALSTGSLFSVYCRPRTSPEFIVPYAEYIKSCEINHSIGTRISMKFESEEFPDPSLAGTVVGIEDLDPLRWPGSKWRCLVVHWDQTTASVACPATARVSPWNIELLSVTNTNQSSHLAQPKRARIRRLSSPLNDVSSFGIDGGNEFHDKSNSNANSNIPSEPMGVAITPKSSSTCIVFGVDLVKNPLKPLLLPTSAITSTELSNCCGIAPLTPHMATADPVKQFERIKSMESFDYTGSGRGTEELLKTNSLSTRRCTQVCKYGSALGSCVDVTRFSEFNALVSELERMFDFKGALMDCSSGWSVFYTDDQGSNKLIGDCPWRTFQAVVQKMYIWPKEHQSKLGLVKDQFLCDKPVSEQDLSN